MPQPNKSTRIVQLQSVQAERLARQLYTRLPWLGGWLRRQAVKRLDQLANQGSLRATKELASALARHPESSVRDLSRAALLKVEEPACMDSIWASWVATRNIEIENILISRGIPAQAPARERVFSLLLLGMMVSLARGTAEDVPPLLEASADSDTRLALPARARLDDLQSPAMVDALCASWADTRDPYCANLIAGCGYVARVPIRLRALSALQANRLDIAQEINPDGLEGLLLAFSGKDLPLSQRAADCLISLKNSETVDLLCAQWARSRQPELEALLIKAGYAAQAPLGVRVLSALLTGQAKLLEFLPSEGVEPLLSASRDSNPVIANGACALMRRLRLPEAQDTLCQVAVERDHPQALSACLEAGYEPRDPAARALYYFATGQWEKYSALDFDRGLLSTLYAGAPPALRQRMLSTLQRSGRTDFLDLLAGGDSQDQVSQLGDQEIQVLVGVLTTNREWERLWKLVSQLSYQWSLQIIRVLSTSEWKPLDGPEAEVFLKLVFLAKGPILENKSEWQDLLPPALLRSKLRVSGRINDVGFSPVRPELSITSSYGKVVIWDFEHARVVHTLSGFSHSLGVLTYTPQGQLVIAERSRLDTDCNIYSWDGSKMTTLGSHRGPVTALQPVGLSRVLSAGRDQRIRLWDISTSRLLVEKTFHFWARSVGIVPGGDMAAMLHHEVTIINLPGLEILPVTPPRFFRRNPGKVRPSVARCAAFLSEGSSLVVGQNNGQVMLYTLKNGRYRLQLAPLTRHIGEVQGIEMIPGHSVLVSAGSDSTLIFTDWPSQRSLGRVNAPGQRLTSLSISADGSFMAVGDSSASLSLWDLRVLDIPLMFTRPLSNASLGQISVLEALMDDTHLPGTVRYAMAYVYTLLRARFQYDINISEPASIQPGEYDIEIESLVNQ